jgi:hypothetical protein
MQTDHWLPHRRKENFVWPKDSKVYVQAQIPAESFRIFITQLSNKRWVATHRHSSLKSFLNLQTPLFLFLQQFVHTYSYHCCGNGGCCKQVQIYD